MARSAAARKARPQAAARTAGPVPERRSEASAPAAPPPERKAAEAETAFRAAEEDAAVRGAEVEPSERPVDRGARVVDLDAAIRRLDASAAARAVTPERWDVSSADVSSAYDGDESEAAAQVPLGGAIAGVARGALRLAATLVTAPVRLALVLPRMALTALRLA
jgi:hypothetical protein